MGEENSRLSGKDLAALMDVDPEMYRSFPRVGPYRIHPLDLLTEAKVVKGFPEGVQRVTGGRYKSGEIWLDFHHEIVYLYIGKTSEENDLVLQLGGYYSYEGILDQGIVNSGDAGKIFFDKRLFP